MLAAEAAYCALEDDLQHYLDTYESTHDYDEYHFDLDEIEHDPYVLLSLLCALHEGQWTIGEVQGTLQMLFDRQYILTEDVVVETRYRTETDTWTDEDGNSHTDIYQVPYDYYICTVTLENFDLSHVPVYVMGEDQLSRYAIYMATLGNRPDLFPDSPYVNKYITGKPGDYEVPGEYLDDETFDKVRARMKANKKAPARSKSDEDFILTGKLVCGNCGALMVGDSGTSHTGATYYYYKCGHRKRKEGERCHMKAFRKELIESFVVKRALGYVLQDSVIAMLADALVENQKRENTHLPALQEELEKVNKKIDNIAAAIEEGIVTQTTKERLTALEAQREELQISIFEEETSHPKLTKEYVVQWLKSFKQRDLRDPKVQRQVIECFVNTVYVFENKLIVNLNLRDGDKPIALSKGNGSDIETFGSPKSTTSFEVVLFSLYALFNRCRA